MLYIYLWLIIITEVYTPLPKLKTADYSFLNKTMNKQLNQPFTSFLSAIIVHSLHYLSLQSCIP